MAYLSAFAMMQVILKPLNSLFICFFCDLNDLKTARFRLNKALP